MKILVLFYSMYGHIYRMAEAVAEGARQVEGSHVDIMRVPETIPHEILVQSGAWPRQQEFAHIPVATIKDLEGYHAYIFGTPTRYGNMAGQMRQFLDTMGALWAKNEFVGKVGSVFTSSNNQHGGQETTIVSFHFNLLHFGMVVAGLPYSFKGQKKMDEITGGSPYGASTMAGPDQIRMPTANELDGARFQGKYVADIASRLFRE